MLGYKWFFNFIVYKCFIDLFCFIFIFSYEKVFVFFFWVDFLDDIGKVSVRLLGVVSFFFVESNYCLSLSEIEFD